MRGCVAAPWAFYLFYLALYAAGAAAMKQSWSFEREDRSHFLIERFGFGPSGRMDVRVTDVAIEAADGSTEGADIQAGLLFVHQDELWEAVALLDDVVGDVDLQDNDDPMMLATGQDQQAQDGDAQDKCALQLRRDSRWVDLADERTWNVSRGRSTWPLMAWRGRPQRAAQSRLLLHLLRAVHARTPGLLPRRSTFFTDDGRVVELFYLTY